ncbi:hypothetical protein, partial [Litorivivens sp.]|uniref:hypothetical protein n=1 Tax=Litorivivens sp. TaxID=2020868 RepID=UPI0035653878
EQILALSDSRWYRPASTNLSALPLPASVNTAIQRVILGLDAHRPWVIKDPRMCLTAPFWLAAMEYPLVLICSRDAHAVAASLHARDNMPPEYAIALWEHYAVSLLKASYAQAKIHLRYEELIEQPTAVIEQIGAQLQAFGVDRLHTPSAAELHAYLQPAAVKPRKHAFPALTQEQLIIQSMLQGDTPIDINVEVSPASRELMARVIQGPPIG